MLDNNLYYNGGSAIPFDAGELVNYTDDAHGVVADPQLAAQSGIVLPRWNPGGGQFADGSPSIDEAFRRTVELYGRPAAGSSVVDAASGAQSPADDILGNPRIGTPDLGAVESSHIFDDGFESGDLSAWTTEIP